MSPGTDRGKFSNRRDAGPGADASILLSMTNSDKNSQGAARLIAIGALAVVAIGVVGIGVFAISSIARAPAPVDQVAGTPAPTAAQEYETVRAAIEASRVYLDQEKPGSAETVLKAAIARFPREQELYFLMGEALLQQDRGEEAYNAYDQGILIGPDHAEYRHVAGTIAAQLGLLDDAELHYRQAQQLAPSNPKYPLYLAQVVRKAGDTDEAKKQLMIATRIAPDLAQAWGSLAAIALEENKLSIALTHIARAREIEPDNLAWRVMEAQALRRNNQPREAAALLTAISEEERRENPGLLQELAACYGLLGRPADAAEAYIAAVGADDSQNPELAYQAAVWLERADDSERAVLFARLAAQQGHEGAIALVEQLDPAGG